MRDNLRVVKFDVDLVQPEYSQFSEMRGAERQKLDKKYARIVSELKAMKEKDFQRFRALSL